MALTAGSIAFTGFNGDGNDNLSFVALTDIAQGTVINFTDSNWSGSSFASGGNAESTMAWTATSAISAGTVVNINNIGSGTLGASAGTVSFTNSNNTGLSNDSEVVYAYIGSAGSPTFLAAISSVGYATSDGTLTGTGLVAGQTAVSFTGGLDIMGYNGPRSGQGSFAAYLAALNNSANWQTQNGSGNQSADGTGPDAPFPTTAFSVTAPAGQSISFSPASVSVAEGNSGTQTLTFTVVRSGGTTGAVNFSGTFGAGSTNAADYGGALPASTFSGTIAAGATSAIVTVTISGDTVGEGNENFALTLTSATNASASVTIGTAAATGTITNDDGIVVSSNSSIAITLANNDQATILSGVTLSGATPVTWVGGSTTPGSVLNNSGTITGSNRAIYTSGSTSGSFTVHNEAGATITAVKDAIKIANLGSGANGTFTLDNKGTISSTGIAGDAGQALDLDDIASANVQTVITNAASGVIQAADADAIRAGTNATINNYGQIVSHNGSASSTGNDAIDFQSAHTGGRVYNSGGLIQGARHGITGDQAITVQNGGVSLVDGAITGGTITGEAGAGINMDTAGTTTTFVTNFGTITGTAVNGGDGDGIDVDGLVEISNFGTIKAVQLTSAANGLNEAIAVGGGKISNASQIVSDQRAITIDDSNGGSAFGATIIINEGTIQGGNGEAISITGTFADTITNSGVITGSVATGGGNDTLTNSGTITGQVVLGAGDDIVNLSTGSVITGIIDGGEGSDTVNLHAASGSTATGSVGQMVDVETLNVASGDWSLNYFFAGANLNVGGEATIVSAISLEGGQTLTVEQGGTMLDSKTAIWISGGDVDANVVNGGTIKVTAAPGANKADAISLNGATATIHNTSTGVIDGARHAITGPLGITVINDAGGLIVGQNGSAVNMDNSPGVDRTAYVTNYGTMLGRSANISDSDGDAIDADGLAVVNNYGLIRGEGHNGYHKGEANVSEGIAIGGGTINNYAGATIYGYGRAVEVDNSSNGPAFAAATILNAGTIQGDGNGPTSVAQADANAMLQKIIGGEAITIVGTYADTLTNTATGEIIGGVKMGGGDDVLINAGTMTATGGTAVDLGDGSDTLTNSGTITGNVLLGEGDDSLNLVTGSTITGTRDGGAGIDTVNLSGAGTGALGATTGFENLVAQEGTWSVAASDYANVTIEDGATVTSTITLDNNDKLTVEAGGSLVNATALIWTGGGDAVVDNAGLIQASSRVFNTTANAAGSFTLNNQAGGVVRGPLSPQQAAAADATVTINNAGMMESSGRVIDFQSLVSSGADVTINNLAGGTIRQTGSDTDVIRPGQNTVVNNHGTITTAPGFAGGGDLIDYQSSTGGKVNNYTGGWMEGSRHVVTGDNAVAVLNEGTMIGRNGSAVNIDNGDSEAEKVFVTNRGTMEGRSAALSDSDGDAVDVDGLAQILNYGRIAGLGANGRHDGEPNVSEGIAIGGGTILNYGTNAEIYGYGRAIQVDNSSNSNALGKTFINNEGLIKGDGHGPEGVTLTPEEVAKFDLRGNEAINLVGDYADEIINGSTGRIVGGVSMGGGNDHLQSMGSFTATGGSAINMGAGNDTVYFYTGTTVQGTVLLGTGDDLVLSTADSDLVIDAGDGDDQMYISGYTGGNDTLSGGAGNDVIYAGFGNDQIDGGADNDTLSGEGGDDVIDGGAGDDHIMGGNGADTLRGGEGNDRIEAGAGDTVEGGAGDDVIEIAAENGALASIDGGDGIDTLELSGAGNGALGRVFNVEKLVVESGVWAITDASDFSEATVESGATLIGWGNGTDTTVEQGGTHYVQGAATGSTVSGQQIVGSGATASETQIQSGGNQLVYGTADETTVGDGGLQSVYGSATDTTVDDGGSQAIYSGGTASGTTLNAGGTQVDWGTASDTTINGGIQYVWGTATGTTIVSGMQLVGNGGTANATTINGGGEQIVYGGGVSNGAFLAGGDQTVYGSANQTTVDDGGLQSVYGSATGTMVHGGGEQSVYVNGVATGTTLNAGGVQINWGTAVDTTIDGGNQYVWGTATGTTILSGVQHVGSGGTASDTTIDSGGIGYVHTGGALHDVTFAGSGATLVLDEADAFSGEISGWQDGDSIALGDITFGESTTLAYVANAGNTGGTLTVSDGSHVASLTLLGQYTAADFALSSNGYGGTVISDPGNPAQAQNVLAPSLYA